MADFFCDQYAHPVNCFLDLGSSHVVHAFRVDDICWVSAHAILGCLNIRSWRRIWSISGQENLWNYIASNNDHSSYHLLYLWMRTLCSGRELCWRCWGLGIASFEIAMLSQSAPRYLQWHDLSDIASIHWLSSSKRKEQRASAGYEQSYGYWSAMCCPHFFLLLFLWFQSRIARRDRADCSWNSVIDRLYDSTYCLIPDVWWDPAVMETLTAQH